MVLPYTLSLTVQIYSSSSCRSKVVNTMEVGADQWVHGRVADVQHTDRTRSHDAWRICRPPNRNCDCKIGSLQCWSDESFMPSGTRSPKVKGCGMSLTPKQRAAQPMDLEFDTRRSGPSARQLGIGVRTLSTHVDDSRTGVLERLLRGA